MTIVPQCLSCRNWIGPTPNPHCRAFRVAIPDKILSNRHDHKRPFPGDHGIRFEEQPRASLHPTDQP
jgi:hypothetical protein